MKKLVQTSAIAALLIAAGTSSFAQMMPDAETLTCGEFSSLTVEDQEIAVAEIEAAKMMMDDNTDTEMDADTDTTMDAEADIETMTDSDADTETETEIVASPPVQDLMSACEGNDDMLAIDAMES